MKTPPSPHTHIHTYTHTRSAQWLKQCFWLLCRRFPIRNPATSTIRCRFSHFHPANTTDYEHFVPKPFMFTKRWYPSRISGLVTKVTTTVGTATTNETLSSFTYLKRHRRQGWEQVQRTRYRTKVMKSIFKNVTPCSLVNYPFYVKATLSLSTPQRHNWSRGITPHILNLNTRRRLSPLSTLSEGYFKARFRLPRRHIVPVTNIILRILITKRNPQIYTPREIKKVLTKTIKCLKVRSYRKLHARLHQVFLSSLLDFLYGHHSQYKVLSTALSTL